MSLSLTEARDQIAALMPGMRRQDIDDLFSPDITEADAAMILESCKNYGVPADEDKWDEVLRIARVCVEIADIVFPVASAVCAVFGVTVAVKAL